MKANLNFEVTSSKILRDVKLHPVLSYIKSNGDNNNSYSNTRQIFEHL